ncbi:MULTISPECIES: hypothetical protein [Microbacterium]|uniref:hypothetical protein n=1 Tax=Microbacterium TaxID=33882 RepID=UPI0006F21C5A|nr:MULTISPECIES: hypothetical protein [Microbacterium]KQR23506.1 hypothetical protein ASF76_10065 [Microbacterium sp. Leaf151]MCI9857024.1 hypothetical protein [Microbacterium proteolyticum]
MSTRSLVIRASAVVVGCVMMGGVASAAFAADPVGPDSDVDVSVDIADITTPGVLAMTVDGSSATLTESGSTGTVRQFTGALPTVTVTDTRTPDEIPAGAFWYVVGTSTDFVGDSGQDPISAGHFGWTPEVADPDGTGLVAAGPEVGTVLDPAPNNVGLVDQELLALANDSAEAVGTWKADADLFLKVPVTTDSGTYSSTLTLSLFE